MRAEFIPLERPLTPPMAVSVEIVRGRAYETRKPPASVVADFTFNPIT